MRKASDADLVIGVDTHLDTHTAAVCDGHGRVQTQLQIPATTAGYQQLLAPAPHPGRARNGPVGDRRHPPLRAGPGPTT